MNRPVSLAERSESITEEKTGEECSPVSVLLTWVGSYGLRCASCPCR